MLRGIFSVLVLSASCAQNSSAPSIPKSSDSEIAAHSSELFEEGLVGIWATKCSPIPNSKGFVRYEYRFGQAQLFNRILTYQTQECKEIYRDQIDVYSYVVGDAIESADIEGTRELDIVYLKTSLTIYNPNLINTYNTNNGYGYSDWQAGVAKDIGGRSYKPTDVVYYEPGKVKYTLVAYDAQYLVDGDFETGDGESQLTRPRSVRTKYPFYRTMKPIVNESTGAL
ncbi:MAG: hypothetical protein AB7T49_12375 [Oligoflexales bacterium]